jgi:hypothetical protein
VVTQVWALASQLVLPLTAPAPWEVMLRDISPLQWAAGLVAIVAGLIVFAAGTKLMRLLVVWTALSMAPFALLDALYTSPRYVYLAAAPYSILVTLLASIAYRELATGLVKLAPRLPHLRWAPALVVVVTLAIGGLYSAQGLQARNESWSRATTRYGLLAEALQRQLPNPPPGATIYVVSGQTVDAWGTALARAIYGDPSLQVKFVSPARLEAAQLPFRRGDIVFYFVGEDLIASSINSVAR